MRQRNTENIKSHYRVGLYMDPPSSNLLRTNKKNLRQSGN